MFQVVFKRRVNIDTERNYVASAEPGRAYLLTDYHVGAAIPLEICAQRSPYTAYRRYAGEDLGTGSLLILWLAGLGDTISLTPALGSLQNRHPHARIDVVTIPALFEVLRAAEFRGEFLAYPPTVDAVRDYDFFVPIEKNALDPDYHRLDSIDFHAKLLCQPSGLRPVSFQVEKTARRRLRLCSDGRVRVGVQARSLSPVRSYPADLLAELLRQLVGRRYEVHLLGQAGDCDVPSAPPLFYNDCGRTQNFAETAALLQQMHVVVCPDSYLMHLAAVLSIPTVALFSTIPARLRTARYKSVVALEPDTPCAPCMVVHDDKCPRGHLECIALRSGRLAPEAVMEEVQALADQRRRSPTASPVKT
jgi:ADP-heptose:LPS heptosyltransferase